MTTPDLTELAERCEKLTGPCKETDVAIYRALAYTTPCEHPSDYDKASHYTASLDAAMTLVPVGMDWRVDTMTGLPGAIVCVTNAWLSHQTAPMLQHGKTPALALTVASLRARAALENSHD